MFYPEFLLTYGETAETFANHLEKVFVPNISMPSDYIISKVSSSLKETYQLDLPIKKFSKSEVIRTIKSQSPKKPQNMI